jgi:hypothetical protein
LPPFYQYARPWLSLWRLRMKACANPASPKARKSQDVVAGFGHYDIEARASALQGLRTHGALVLVLLCTAVMTLRSLWPRLDYWLMPTVSDIARMARGCGQTASPWGTQVPPTLAATTAASPSRLAS